MYKKERRKNALGVLETAITAVGCISACDELREMIFLAPECCRQGPHDNTHTFQLEMTTSLTRYLSVAPDFSALACENRTVNQSSLTSSLYTPSLIVWLSYLTFIAKR